MNLNLPSWLIWVAAALGLVTSLIAIVQAVRISSGGQSESLGHVISQVFRSAIVIVPLFALLVTCGFCGWNAYSQNKDYNSKPEAEFTVSQYLCASHGHLYVHIKNPSGRDWQYAIQIADKDPAGSIWASVPRYQSGSLPKDDALTIALTVASSLCAHTGTYTHFAMRATVTFTSASPIPGVGPTTIVENPTLTIVPK